ncbi:hypothetical protein [Streptomyces globisporus]|uniref:hypothetical protein n=1 Tax=Streptomyces globisporus TaxID=1908 RepID=UPI0004CA87D9|nr:hypothetical protein [Streptomyces globisporus]
MTEPFGTDELMVRPRAATRRLEEAPPRPQTAVIVTTEELTVDLPARKVRRHSRDVRLTPTEWHLLETLVAHPRVLISRRRLLLAGRGTGR